MPEERRLGRRKSRHLAFRIKLAFASNESENRAWQMFRHAREDQEASFWGDTFEAGLKELAAASSFRPSEVKVSVLRGSIELLIILEGIRIGYELLSEYKDFRESAELLLSQLESYAQQSLEAIGFGPVVSSGQIIGLPDAAVGRKQQSLFLQALRLLVLLQFGIFGLIAFLIWKAPPLIEAVNHSGTASSSWTQVFQRPLGELALTGVVLPSTLFFVLLVVALLQSWNEIRG